MDLQTGIAESLSLLEKIDPAAPDPPAMIVMPPDSGDFIIGNSGGFVRLAIAALMAAQGQPQAFKNEAWVSVQDLDWGVQGLKLDPTAHIYLPPKRTRLQHIGGSLWGYCLLLLVVGVWVTGFVTILHWVWPSQHHR